MASPSEATPLSAIEDAVQTSNSSGQISHLDGLVGALINDGRSFVTSPNVDFIPDIPLGDVEVAPYFNYDYGPYDPIYTPQFSSVALAHMRCIPRRPTQRGHSYWHQSKIVWDDFDPATMTTHEDGSRRDLVSLSASASRDLETRLVSILQGMELDLAKKAIEKPGHGSMFIQGLIFQLHHAFHRLKKYPARMEVIAQGFSAVRRLMLECMAWQSYITRYRPHMQNNYPLQQVGHVMGTITRDQLVAKECFVSGIPVWLIRPAEVMTSARIDRMVKVVSLLGPLPLVRPSPPFPVIYRGSAEDERLQFAISDATRAFLSLGDPFGAEAEPVPSASGAHRAPIRVIPLVPEASERTSTGPARKKQRRSPEKKPDEDWPKNNPPIRDKFAELSGPFAPPPIPYMKDANGLVDRRSARSLSITKKANDNAYHFPEPGFILGPTKPERIHAYLWQWRRIRQPFIYRVLYKSRSRPFSAVEWRDILGSASSVRESGEKPSAGQQKNQERMDRIESMIIEMFKMSGHEFSEAPSRGSYGGEQITQRKAQETIFEISEFNFRFELLALDRRALDEKKFGEWKNSSTFWLFRQGMVMAIFPGDSNTLMDVHVKDSRSGLAAEDWQTRRRSLKAWWKVMNDWEGEKPASWDWPVEDTPGDAEKRWERDLVVYYVQNFFDYFGRPAILPRTLEAAAS